MEASGEDRKPRVLFHGLKIFGSVLKTKSRDKLCRPKLSPPKGSIESTLKVKPTTTSLNLLTGDTSEISVKNNSRIYGIKDEDISNFILKTEPSDVSDDVNRYDGDISVVDAPRFPDDDHIAESKLSSTREKSDDGSVNNTISTHCISKESGHSLKDTHVAITNKSHKARLKRVPCDSDDDEITVLRSDFPATVKQFNWSEKRKSQINVESSSPDRYISKPNSPAGLNLCDEKTNSCGVNSGNSLEGSRTKDDPMLFCDINDSKLGLCNALKEEYCHIKFKENLEKIDQVSVKEEPCDLNMEDEGNDSGIGLRSSMRSDISSDVAPKIDGKVTIKNEPCDNTIEDDGNDSGIHSPLRSETSSIATPKQESCESDIKLELGETDQNILIDEPWLPWLPLDTRENEKLKGSTGEADLLQQIKKELEPKCVSKKKLANKYISKYQKPQLNETGQTFNCSECDKSFAMRNLLSHHIIYEHNTLQLLKCPVCYRRFNKLNGLSNHIRATHKIIRHHVCKLCHHSFSRHHYLVYHMRSVHKDFK